MTEYFIETSTVVYVYEIINTYVCTFIGLVSDVIEVFLIYLFLYTYIHSHRLLDTATEGGFFSLSFSFIIFLY